MNRQLLVAALVPAALSLAACQGPASPTTASAPAGSSTSSAPATTASSGTSNASPSAAGTLASPATTATVTATATTTASASTTASFSASPADAALVEECLADTGFCFQHAERVRVDEKPANKDRPGILAAGTLARDGIAILDYTASTEGIGAGCIPQPDKLSKVVWSQPVEIPGLEAVNDYDQGAQAYAVQGIEGRLGTGYAPFTALTTSTKAPEVGVPLNGCEATNLRIGVFRVDKGKVRVDFMTPPGLIKFYPTEAEAEAALNERPAQAAKEILLTSTWE